ncbi:uncharacterized protein LOC113279760 [Papaver somniferum]|uniref:uncharacterized protein LOC113279760 n=1 Tax=Papaver somniferum TaxID=3469 RepID=UPI000E702FE1|nr:uncharacterized protein LOC113279760 [Papaver somniferum]
MEAIPKLMIEEDNIFLDAVPTAIEIKEAVFSMNSKSAPGFIPKGLNSNFLFLLPKNQGARIAEQFRPIGLANFIFKIFIRIITTRISSLIIRLISSQQSAFIKGRNIHDKIVLASEMISELNIKIRGGNVGLKLDITQAFDSLSWEFLFEVLRRFGFSEVGINWIRKIFESGMISMLVNGGPCGFFGVGRGIIQDDIFIFCNGHKKSLDNLMNLLNKYQLSSGQIVNRNKSKCFVCGISDTRRNGIADYLQMRLSELPNIYLGVILCPGRVKTYQVWGMVELMQKMLAGLKCVITEINNNKRWIVAYGKSISVWKDEWIKDYDFIERYAEDQFVPSNINLKVADLIVDGVWKIPIQIFNYFEKNEVPTIGDGPDKLI